MGDEARWPVLEPVNRKWTWFGRATVVLIATGSVLKIVDAVLDPGEGPVWLWVFIVGWTLLVLIASARAWVLAGRAHRLVPNTAHPRADAAEYRAARAFLRAGAALTDRQRRLVAGEVAQRELTRGMSEIAVAVLGLLGVSLSTRGGPLTSGTFVLVLVLYGIGLVAIGVWATARWRGRRLRDEAARMPDAHQHER